MGRRQSPQCLPEAHKFVSASNTWLRKNSRKQKDETREKIVQKYEEEIALGNLGAQLGDRNFNQNAHDLIFINLSGRGNVEE